MRHEFLLMGVFLASYTIISMPSKPDLFSELQYREFVHHRLTIANLHIRIGFSWVVGAGACRRAVVGFLIAKPKEHRIRQRLFRIPA